MKRICYAAVSGVLLACAAPEDSSYSIVVRVESDPGVPLAGALLEREHRELARSDERGELRAELRGQPGDRVQLDVTCPAGHSPPAEPLSVLLRGLAEGDATPEFQVRCPPIDREIVVAVRATHGPNLPLRYLGREVARTDAGGVAHALLRAAPGETMTLRLDTSGARKLMPQNPELRFQVPERDELVVFDQVFDAPKPKPKPRKAPEPEGPRRI